MANDPNAPGLDIEINTSATGTGIKDTARDLKELEGAAKNLGLANRATSSGEVLRDYGKAANEASTSVKSFGSTAKGVQEIVHGLERAAEGGVGGLVGLGQAARGAGHLLHTAFAGLGPVLIGVTAGLVAVKLAIDSVVDKAQSDLKRAFHGVGEETEKLKQATKDMAESSKKEIESEAKEVEKLGKSYTDLAEKQAKGAKRSKENADATLAQQKADLDRAEQVALGKAKTPKEKEAIAGDFAAKREVADTSSKIRQLDSEDLQAKNKVVAAQEAANALRERQRAADLVVDIEKKRADDLVDLARRATQKELEAAGREDADAAALRRVAKEQRGLAAAQKIKAENAENAADEERKNQAPQLKQIDDNLQDATNSLEDNQKKRLLLRTGVDTGGRKKTNKSKDDADSKKGQIDELKQRANEAMGKGDFAGQDKAVAELQKLQQELLKDEKQAAAESAANIKAAADSIDTATKSIPKPIDSAPLSDSFKGYHQSVVELQTGNQQAIQTVSTDVAALTREIATLRRQISNLSKK